MRRGWAAERRRFAKRSASVNRDANGTMPASSMPPLRAPRGLISSNGERERTSAADALGSLVVARSRPITEMYIAAVERAVASPGLWIEVPRRFRTEFNARITADCLAGGYLRVEVRQARPLCTWAGSGT